ncbi:MAG: hypothetical protein Q9222_006259 [Ikaeria aurantiellina]
MQLSGTNLLSLTATDLRDMLDQGAITSKILIQSYLNHISAHNRQGMGLRAIIDVAPEANILKLAEELDFERQAGKSRGPFHGVPLVIKDTINTDSKLGMDTTLGSYALRGARPPGNSRVVQAEFGSNKSPDFVAGFSPVGGQTRSAYIERGDLATFPENHESPMGSSSGSAVAVSAGFSPWSIGAETNGSLNSPASRASLYALKPTVGSVSDDGVFKLTDAFDSLGAMAKCVDDLAALTEILLSTVPGRLPPSKISDGALRQKIKGLRLGFVDADQWLLPESILKADESYLKQRRAHYQQAINRMKNSGAMIIHPLDLRQASEYTFEGQSAYSLIRYGQWPALARKYLSTLLNTNIRSLEDIIAFSEENPDLECYPEAPDQQSLIKALKQNTSPELLARAVTAMRKAAADDGLGKAIDDHKLDALIAPTDSDISTVAALAGYPIGTMPLGYLEPSGRPHGLSVLAKADCEKNILEVMRAWEASGFERRLPPPLVKQLTGDLDSSAL